MTDPHQDYDRAQQDLLDAQAAVAAVDVPATEIAAGHPELVEQLTVAQEAMEAAIEVVADEVDAAWEANRVAVQDAKQAVTEARRAQAAVEVQVGNAARDRDRRYPVMNEDEIAQVVEARATLDTAKQALTEAEQRFKGGVTVDQLEVAG